MVLLFVILVVGVAMFFGLRKAFFWRSSPKLYATESQVEGWKVRVNETEMQKLLDDLEMNGGPGLVKTAYGTVRLVKFVFLPNLAAAKSSERLVYTDKNIDILAIESTSKLEGDTLTISFSLAPELLSDQPIIPEEPIQMTRNVFVTSHVIKSLILYEFSKYILGPPEKSGEYAGEIIGQVFGYDVDEPHVVRLPVELEKVRI